MARYKRNTLKLDTKPLEQLLTKLEQIGGNVPQATEAALKVASDKIAEDTENAIRRDNLPAQGKYSIGKTAKTVIKNPVVKWEGTVAWVPVGFDFDKEGAGGFLISGAKASYTGTPRRKPIPALRTIYKSKRYMDEVQKLMKNLIYDEINKRWVSK